jgi:hypothetical protein
VNIASEMSKWLLECDPQVRPHSRHIWAELLAGPGENAVQFREAKFFVAE